VPEFFYATHLEKIKSAEHIDFTMDLCNPRGWHLASYYRFVGKKHLTDQNKIKNYETNTM
jgi:hypothetical protein